MPNAHYLYILKLPCHLKFSLIKKIPLFSTRICIVWSWFITDLIKDAVVLQILQSFQQKACAKGTYTATHDSLWILCNPKLPIWGLFNRKIRATLTQQVWPYFWYVCKCLSALTNQKYSLRSKQGKRSAKQRPSDVFMVLTDSTYDCNWFIC